ncbi:MAG: type II toxin-antitoxin system PemK/MazF family toxin [Thermodesulfobacteriota bacterium]
MIYEPWSVVVVPFPFIDRRQVKRRPTVVLSPAPFQEGHRCSVLGMITDARNPPWPTDVPLTDVEAAGLRLPSVFRCKIFTLDSGLILSQIGELSVRDRRAVKRVLRLAIAG